MTTDSPARPATTRPGIKPPPVKPTKRPSATRSNIGLKALMAVTGLLMLTFVVLHMVGNLKIFFGEEDFDGYSEFLRRILAPILPESGYLWVQRVGLVAIVVLHMVAAYVLTRRDKRARPVKYLHKPKQRTSYATQTMRWGGVIIILFIVYHILDLSTGTLNPNGVSGQVYDNVIADFQVWYITLAYVVAMLALGIHIEHGFWSAAYTLGVRKPSRAMAFQVTARVLAVVITAGFLVVPLSIQFGLIG